MQNFDIDGSDPNQLFYLNDTNVTLEGQGNRNFVRITSHTLCKRTLHTSDHVCHTILTLASGNSANIRKDEPFLSYAIFDPRLIEKTPGDRYGFITRCELVTWVVVPSLARNIIHVEQVNVNDVEHDWKGSDACGGDDIVGLAYYRVSVTSIPLTDSTTAKCDINNSTTDRTKGCLLRTDLSYMSYITTTMRSRREKDRKGIILDESAIAGGFTFFAYFLSVFVL